MSRRNHNNTTLAELHSFGEVNNKPIIVNVQSKLGTESTQLSFIRNNAIGNGSFGVVYAARIQDTNEQVAIKKVLQDKRFKNRELQIMKLVDHPNLVELKYYFYTNGLKNDQAYLNLILEQMQETIYRTLRNYERNKMHMPIFYVKLYTYQILRSVAYIHSLGICHRDIKPQNLLVNPSTGVLKLCDFGSAKVLTKGEPNVAYICSRYYRAPELVFGAIYYTTKIDVWSVGCVMAELMLGRPLFPGQTGVDQLIEIIKVLGTPTKEQIRAMNPRYLEHKFPSLNPNPISMLFSYKVPSEAIDLLQKILVYEPLKRISALEAMAHPFFDELRDAETRMPNGNNLPPLFSFSAIELSPQPELFDKLVPTHQMRNQLSILEIEKIEDFVPIPEKDRKVPSLG